MSITVVMPVYNGAETVQAAVRSLLRQLGPGDQLICVDDGSTDDTRERLDGLPVTVLESPGRGAAAARNFGAAHATGEVLVFADADIVAGPRSLAKLLGGLACADAAVGFYDGGDPELGRFSWAKNTAIRVAHKRSGRDISWFWTAFGAVRREAFEACAGFDAKRFSGATVEDMDFGYRLSAAGWRIVQVFDATVQHRHRLDAQALVRNDFLKSRDWARLLVRHRTGGRHGATRPSLLREDLRLAVRERGVIDAMSYVAIRAALYPVAAAGAMIGGIEELLT